MLGEDVSAKKTDIISRGYFHSFSSFPSYFFLGGVITPFPETNKQGKVPDIEKKIC